MDIDYVSNLFIVRSTWLHVLQFDPGIHDADTLTTYF